MEEEYISLNNGMGHLADDDDKDDLIKDGPSQHT